jgi:hypothetical protein
LLNGRRWADASAFANPTGATTVLLNILTLDLRVE